MRNVFGDVFEGFTILNTGQDKDEVLVNDWGGSECWWIEDKGANIKMGNDASLKSILIDHAWNRDCEYPCDRARTWKDVYNIIEGIV